MSSSSSSLCIPDLKAGKTVKFLRGFPPRDNRISHTLFTGGSYYVPEERMDELRENLEIDRRGNLMPALNEIHTVKFPLFADLDMVIPQRMLMNGAVTKVASVMTEAVMSFYPSLESVRCVVCRKGMEGKRVENDDTKKGEVFKHGIHLYWPDIILTSERAVCICLNSVCFLDRVLDWSLHFGVARLPWSEFVDTVVYRPLHAAERSRGLRCLFAPKAYKCDHDDGADFCEKCYFENNNCIVQEKDFYRPVCMLTSKKGGGEEEETSIVAKDIFRLSSVRCPERVSLTAGYIPFDGHISVPENWGSNVSSGAGGKKKGKGKSEEDNHLTKEAKIPGRYTLVENPSSAMLTESTRLASFFSEKYSLCRPVPKFNGTKYVVQMTGHNSTYCINKGDRHSKSTVYLDIFLLKKTDKASCQMRCLCKKDIIRRGGKTCKDYRPALFNLNPYQKVIFFGKRDTVSSVRKEFPFLEETPNSSTVSSSRNEEYESLPSIVTGLQTSIALLRKNVNKTLQEEEERKKRLREEEELMDS